MALRLLDVVGPLRVLVDGIDAEADDLDVPLVELGFQLRHVAELGRADGGEILRMREEHCPGVADPFVKADASLRRVGFEIRSHVTELKSHRWSSL